MQLKHDAEETSREVHGFVRVLNDEGELLAEHETMQHNREYSNRAKLAGELALAVVAAVKVAPSA